MFEKKNETKSIIVKIRYSYDFKSNCYNKFTYKTHEFITRTPFLTIRYTENFQSPILYKYIQDPPPLL